MEQDLDFLHYMKCIMFMLRTQIHYLLLKQKIVKVLILDLKKVLEYGVKLDLTYFNIQYDNVLEGWKNNNSSGAAYTTQNADGVSKISRT